MAIIYNSIQGNIGLGKAIEYFTSWNITVALPLNDTQKYDLIADFDGKLQRISVKTSRYTRNDGHSYPVLLKNCGGASRISKTRYFDNTSCDYIFIYTGDDNTYLIPANIIEAKNTITVGNKYTEYLVKPQKLSEYNEYIETL